MSKVHITPLHCTDCAEDLVERLEETSGRKGFSYDGSRQSLVVPDDIDWDKLEHVLNADKIYILPREENAPAVQVHRDHEEEHTHSHGHHHGHGEGLRGQNAEKNIFLVFIMNLVFSVIEFFAGIILNSTSILADAVHDFGDALSVGSAWIFEKISMRHSNRQFTFGHRRFSLLGALITGTFLILGSFFTLSRAVPRLFAPQEVNYRGMLYLSIAAILMNGFAAYLLLGKRSKNESLLTLHMLEDLFGWVGILVISIILHFRPWYILDPIVSIIIALVILREAVRQTIGTLKILLESVPEGVDLEGLEEQILAVEGVHGLSHLHFWSMDGEENNFAVTLFTDEADTEAQRRIRKEIQNFLVPAGVNCATIEINYDPDRLLKGKLE